MIYIFTGEDSAEKDKKIAAVKKKHLTSGEAQEFDYDSHFGAKCDPDELKKSLLNLPTVVAKRLVVVRAAHKLNSRNKEIILNFAAANEDYNDVILDWDQEDPKNSFLSELSSGGAKTLNFSVGKKSNVFDVTRAMEARRPADALKILNTLWEDGNHPLQVMGGLVWFWGNSKRRVTAPRFRKGLQYLQEADLNIKRSRLKPEYAVETLVVKLSSLIT